MRTLWIVADNLQAAKRVAYAIDAGRITAGERHMSEDAAEAWADIIADVTRCRPRVFAVVLEKRAVDDGVITNVWPLDRVGDAAAAFLLFVGAPVLAAKFWWVLS